MNKKLSFFTALLTAMTLMSCASKKEKEMPTVKVEQPPSKAARQVAKEEDASQVTEFSFKKGSAELTDTAKLHLRKAIDQAKQKGDIKDMRVITWGDAEYPSKEEKTLSKEERDLVKKRNKAIRDYVKVYDEKVDVETYSMAERPGILKELLNTKDVKIKKSLETAGIQTSGTTVKAPAKASKSVVMVITE
ncbi:MAG: hypothetical protein ACXVCP_08290 [Bdellovibrio sp.]